MTYVCVCLWLYGEFVSHELQTNTVPSQFWLNFHPGRIRTAPTVHMYVCTYICTFGVRKGKYYNNLRNVCVRLYKSLCTEHSVNGYVCVRVCRAPKHVRTYVCMCTCSYDGGTGLVTFYLSDFQGWSKKCSHPSTERSDKACSRTPRGRLDKTCSRPPPQSWVETFTHTPEN